jgi:GABA permease
MEPRSILIVANQTAAGEHLKALVRERMAAGASRFTLLVPATPPTEHLTWTEGEAHALAKERLAEAIAGLRETGAEIEGMVGDPRPLSAIGDALLERSHDEIVVSTLPAGASRWLKQDLPNRVERQFGLPVTHILAEPAATQVDGS